MLLDTLVNKSGECDWHQDDATARSYWEDVFRAAGTNDCEDAQGVDPDFVNECIPALEQIACEEIEMGNPPTQCEGTSIYISMPSPPTGATPLAN